MMKTVRNSLLQLLALTMLGASAVAQAHDGGPRVQFGLSLGFGPYYPGYPYYPYAPYAPYAPFAPYYYAPPRPVIVQQPIVVQQAPSEVYYQYYCPGSNAYYPAVPTCNQPWLRVVPDGSNH